MKRREFLVRTMTALGAQSIAGGAWSLEMRRQPPRAFEFRPYRPDRTLVPVTCVTPDDGFYLHTFYDVCPLSPSQRYLALTRFPYQERLPRWGDEADVCVVDLQERTLQTLYTTRAWSFQLGANVQWGSHGDRFLYCNDIIGDKPVCVRLDLESEEVRVYAGAKYDISPSERYIVSPNLLTMNTHQYGYAVPDRVYGQAAAFTRDDMAREGLWRTDLDTNHVGLLASLLDFERAVTGSEAERAFYAESVNYLFHSKINRTDTRIMQVFRGVHEGRGRNASLFTLNTDGTGIIQCLTKEQWNQESRLGGGTNHPNWHPDGEHIVANCTPTWLGYQDMRLCQFRFDGSNFRVLSEHHLGSGHPSVNADSTFLLADTYPKEYWFPAPNGEVSLRLLDLRTDQEHLLCTISVDVGNNNNRNAPQGIGSHFKLDPHPAWSHDYRSAVFNGAPQHRRQVFMADLSELVG